MDAPLNAVLRALWCCALVRILRISKVYYCCTTRAWCNPPAPMSSTGRGRHPRERRAEVPSDFHPKRPLQSGVCPLYPPLRQLAYANSGISTTTAVKIHATDTLSRLNPGSVQLLVVGLSVMCTTIVAGVSQPTLLFTLFLSQSFSSLFENINGGSWSQNRALSTPQKK